jgi:hypothetical protein
MSPDDVHKILEPYLFAVALGVAILLGTVWLLYRDGKGRR